MAAGRIRILWPHLRTHAFTLGAPYGIENYVLGQEASITVPIPSQRLEACRGQEGLGGEEGGVAGC